jgi:hypothetical protein
MYAQDAHITHYLARTHTPTGTKVVEIECAGVGVAESRMFSVVNPTDKDYRFKWTAIAHDSSVAVSRHQGCISAGPFRCLVSGGLLQAGTRCDMTFEYRPSGREVRETFWKFEIESEGVVVPFVVVGKAKEPKVSLSTHYVDLVPLLVGQTVTETIHLRNDDDAPQRFAFGKRTILDVNKAAVLSVSPMEGTVMPNTSLPITLTFTPKLVQLYNFQLFCNVKNKAERESVTVRCNAHAIDCALVEVGESDSQRQLVSSEGNEVNLGDMSAFDQVRASTLLAVRERVLRLMIDRCAQLPNKALDPSACCHHVSQRKFISCAQSSSLLFSSLSACRRRRSLRPCFALTLLRIFTIFSPFFLSLRRAILFSLLLQVSRAFQLTNRGNLPVTYEWRNATRKGQMHLSITPPPQSLAPGDSVRHEVMFTPDRAKDTRLQRTLVECRVVNGPTFALRFTASARLPQLEWSFSDFDFGDAFVWMPNMPKREVLLTVTNR